MSRRALDSAKRAAEYKPPPPEVIRDSRIRDFVEKHVRFVSAMRAFSPGVQFPLSYVVNTGAATGPVGADDAFDRIEYTSLADVVSGGGAVDGFDDTFLEKAVAPHILSLMIEVQSRVCAYAKRDISLHRLFLGREEHVRYAISAVQTALRDHSTDSTVDMKGSSMRLVKIVRRDFDSLCRKCAKQYRA